MAVRRILHPTDLSHSGSHALKQAVQLALAHGATLHVFHAVLLHAEDPARLEPELEAYARRAKQEAETWLREATSGSGPLDLEVSVGRGVSPFDAIMDKVNDLRPDIVVMATHGRTGLNRFLMGSEAEKVLRHADCNVLTLRPDARLGGSPDGFRHALVAVDFSDHARRALHITRSLLSRSGRVTMLHVVDPIPHFYYAGGVTSRFQLDPDLQARVEERLREWSSDAESDIRVMEGSPAEEIVRAADALGADVVAIGSRGLTGLEHVLLGSVAERVCRFARLPVLTVK
jgi:nucleotide-binding universal stress UspA family protein